MSNDNSKKDDKYYRDMFKDDPNISSIDTNLGIKPTSESSCSDSHEPLVDNPTISTTMGKSSIQPITGPNKGIPQAPNYKFKIGDFVKDALGKIRVVEGQTFKGTERAYIVNHRNSKAIIAESDLTHLPQPSNGFVKMKDPKDGKIVLVNKKCTLKYIKDGYTFALTDDDDNKRAKWQKDVLDNIYSYKGASDIQREMRELEELELLNKLGYDCNMIFDMIELDRKKERGDK